MPKSLVYAVAAGLLLSPTAFAKKPPLNLSAFAGKYTGTVTLVTPSDTQRGSANVVISVTKSGKTATIAYTAVVFNGSDNVVLPTTISLAKDKTSAVTDLGVGIAGTNNAHRGTGTWSQRKRLLTVSATNGDINLTVTGIEKDAGKKRRLTLTLLSSDADGSNPYLFTTTLTAKAPKPKK